MAAGGARTPQNPAPVSGPGALSRRTDGGPGQPVRNPGGLPYGENQELATQQASAPMAGGAPGGGPTTIPPELASLMGGGGPAIGAPTQYPDEPVTSGAPAGPGAGPEVMASAGLDPASRAKLLNQIKPMMRLAERPDASPQFRNLVAYLRSL